MSTTNRKRDDDAYQIDSLSKGLAVLEALEGTSFEPVPLARIVVRTQLSRNFVLRALRTYRLRGYAVQNARGEWMPGGRLIRLMLKAHESDLNSARGI